MLNNKQYSARINESDLEGNPAIPGEEGAGRPSWLNTMRGKISQSSQEYQRSPGREDIMTLVRKSMTIQRGHEEELGKLVEDSFRELFGSLLDHVKFDFRITDGNEIKQKADETEPENEEATLEGLEDQNIIDEIHKRKIIRTVLQGTGIKSKSLLNLAFFRDGLVEILGQNKAGEYLTVLNKLAKEAQNFYLTAPELNLKQMIKFGSPSGVNTIEIKKKEEEEDPDLAQKILDDLATEDIDDNPDVEELISGLDIKIIAMGQDLSVLIHEAIKGVYHLIIQASMDELVEREGEETGVTVKINTDSRFDEIQELKYGPEMKGQIIDYVNSFPLILEKMSELIDGGASDIEIASFQEKIHYLLTDKMSKTPASQFLKIMNDFLAEDDTTEFDNLIKSAVNHYLEEEDYEQYKEEYSKWREEDLKYREEPDAILPRPSSRDTYPEEPKEDDYSQLTKDELNDMIIDAYSRKDMKEVDRLRKFLGEALNLKHFIGRIRLNS